MSSVNWAAQVREYRLLQSSASRSLKESIPAVYHLQWRCNCRERLEFLGFRLTAARRRRRSSRFRHPSSSRKHLRLIRQETTQPSVHT